MTPAFLVLPPCGESGPGLFLIAIAGFEGTFAKDPVPVLKIWGDRKVPLGVNAWDVFPTLSAAYGRLDLMLHERALEHERLSLRAAVEQATRCSLVRNADDANRGAIQWGLEECCTVGKHLDWNGISSEQAARLDAVAAYTQTGYRPDPPALGEAI